MLIPFAADSPKMNFSVQLQAHGYIHIPRALNASQCQQALDCLRTRKENAATTVAAATTTVNNISMTRFVNEVFLRKVQSSLRWNYVSYTKYRVSDNNNSSDASCFHRDILVTKPPKHPDIPDRVYTCLVYFDPTVMQLIPGSHRQTHMGYLRAISQFTKTKDIRMQPGDILIFHSTLLHRGIFTEKLPHRRLIQVFEVFNDRHHEKDILEHTTHIPAVAGDAWKGAWMERLSKVPGIISFMNWIGYINAATGYNLRARPVKFGDLEGHGWYSSEASRPRSSSNNANAGLNTYVLNPVFVQAKRIHDFPEWLHPRAKFLRDIYSTPYLIYSAVTLGVLILMAVAAYKCIMAFMATFTVMRKRNGYY